MSFIRCLSNPEGLYIWHDVNGKVAVCHYTRITYVNTRDFLKACRKYLHNNEYVKTKTVQLQATPDFKVALTLNGNRRIEMYEVTWHYIAANAVGRIV